MSDLTGAENVTPQTDAGTGQEVTQPDNPAWGDFLKGFPESMHDSIKPHLRTWDDGVNQRMQQVHSEYAPFKALRDAGYTPEVLQQAADVYNAINADPRQVWELLGQSYGFEQAPVNNQQQIPQQGQINPQQQFNQPAQGDEYDLGQGGQFNPELARYQQMTETMANIILQQEQQRQEAAEDAALDSELKAAQQKYGNFDEQFVLGYVNAGVSVDQAVQAYQSMVNQIRSDSNRPAAPTVINGSGTAQLPSQQINPANLNGKDTRALVANMVRAANQQR